MFLNKEKCFFVSTRVYYLGHFITKEGVSTDPSKILAISSWPLPSNVKRLHGFLGLSGYYRQFVNDFGKIAKPLTDLMKKDNFLWSEQDNYAFQLLKLALTKTHVVALPCFTKTFVVETDASGKVICPVLMQNHHPVAYISKTIGPKRQALSIYER